ncbi:MAG: sodium:calcium antiporter [Planctomycetota bacterium]
MLLDALLLILGFVLLAKGADSLVDGAATLATKLGIDPWVVGLTVVAWGTSLPEVVISSLAAYEGSPGAALGNVLGSNVANAGLVLGTVGLILPRALEGRLSLRESVPLILSLAGLYFVLRDGMVTRIEALVLLVVFFVYTAELILIRGRGDESMATELDHTETHAKYPLVRVLLGSVAIAVAAKFFVLDSAFRIADALGLREGFVGLVILALGTSLPELAAGVVSARRGHAEIGLGNIVGSNVFNTLAVIGVSAAITPFGVPGADQEGWDVALEEAMHRDLPVNFVFALALVVGPSLARGRGARRRAAALLLGWVAYVVWVGAAA